MKNVALVDAISGDWNPVEAASLIKFKFHVNELIYTYFLWTTIAFLIIFLMKFYVYKAKTLFNENERNNNLISSVNVALSKSVASRQT